ncbi:ribosome maturation factor RimP [Cellulomonas composti]|uniref:Ribosome maturation factor RimP n=1 Tax=Cellulomonas composti TaxID=266130 RepID=A0A511J8K8_9CELL|nr:ribosome maturation factor RimP [Cellulomonas composti]GEL94330.1 ribosome maturation factor RimP [Cellulomonas composti]
MADAPPQRLRSVLAPVVESVGLVLDDVVVRRTGGTTLVEIALDVPQDEDLDLDLDRIADATRAISAALDEHDDLVPGHYTLEVGSRGAESPLTQRRHFLRAVGRTVRVRTTSGDNISGRLVAVEQTDDDGAARDIVVVVPVTPGVKGRRPREGAPVSLELTAIADARVQVDLSGLGSDDENGGERSGAPAAGQEI